MSEVHVEENTNAEEHSSSEETESGINLYLMLSDATSMDLLEDESPEDYKQRLVEAFGELEGDDFDALPEEVKDWSNAASKIHLKNRRSRNKLFLPVISGLPVEDPATLVVADAPKKVRVRGEKKEKVAKAPKEPRAKKEKPEKLVKIRDARTNRYYRIMSLCMDFPNATTEELVALSMEKLGVKYDIATIKYGMTAFSGAKLLFEDRGLLKD